MSGKIKNKFLVFSCLLLMYGCQDKMIPSGYLSNPNQLDKSITGSWIAVSVYPDSIKDTITVLSGELLAIDNDTFHILTAQAGLISLNEKRIKYAKLYFFNRPNIPLIGYMGLVPNIIGAISSPEAAGYFLMLGIPLFLTSSIVAIANNSKVTGSNSTVVYKGKNSIKELSGYARFPQGLPPGLQKDKLHLVIK